MPPSTPPTQGRAVHFPSAAALVVADLHVGRAAASNAGPLLDERADLRERLAAVVAATDPETVVLAGDLLHRFGTPRARAVGTLRTLAGRIRAAGARPVAVAGNHDGGLDDAWPGAVHDAYRLADGTVVCHGHEAPATDAARYVCGHVHPALTVEGDKRDCFLWTESGYRDRPTLVLPAFSAVAAGVRVERRDDVDSPLVSTLDATRPGVVADGETLWFPPLSDLRPHLRRR